jgi:hypothetical protein
VGYWALDLWWHAGFVLLSWKQHHRTALQKAHVGNWAPKLPLPAGLVLLSEEQSHRTALPEAHVGNQVLDCLLSAGFVLLSQQQLLWLLEAHTTMQVDHSTSTAWGGTEQFKPACLVQLVTQCQEPATTHQSNLKL